MEWLQPSGRRPEGCCRSTELSGGRGQLPEVTGYRRRRTMHAPCMLRLTLADVWRRQPESHDSFELACCNAAGRCSTSISMYITRAVQRKQRRSDAEGRECSSPHTHRVAPAALWTLCSDASGHDRPIPPTCERVEGQAARDRAAQGQHAHAGGLHTLYLAVKLRTHMT